MLIGIHGRAQSGKDQSYRYIAEWAKQEGLACRREAFADRMKWSMARIFHPDMDLGVALHWAETLKEPTTKVALLTRYSTKRSCYISGREFLQHYGTEAHRDIFGKDFWLDLVFDTYHGDEEILVITDVRLPNEATGVHDLGGQVWHIIREGAIELPYAADHSTEQPLPPKFIDRTIHNNGSLDLLRDLVQSQMERMVYA